MDNKFNKKIETKLISDKDLELIEKSNIDKSTSSVAYQCCYAAVCMAHDFTSQESEKKAKEEMLEYIEDERSNYDEDSTYMNSYLDNLKKKYDSNIQEDLLSPEEAKLIKKDIMPILILNPIDVNGDLYLDQEDADLLFKICYVDYMKDSTTYDESGSPVSNSKATSFFGVLGSLYAQKPSDWSEIVDMLYELMYNVSNADGVIKDSEERQLKIIKDILYDSNPRKGNIDNLKHNFYYLKSVNSVILKDTGYIFNVDEHGDWEITEDSVCITDITNYEWFESLNQDEISIVDNIKQYLKDK